MKLCVFILFFSFQQQIYGRARHAIDDNLEDGEDMKVLRGDAVRAGEEEENKWFKAISPATLDKLITEMNSMNRWFAKVVKYWDDFTAGNNGASVLEKEGKGIRDGTEEVEVDGKMVEEEAVGEDGASTPEGPEFGGDDSQIIDNGGVEEKSGDGEEKPYDEEKKKDDEEEIHKGDGEEKPYDMGDEKPYDMGDEKPYDMGDEKPYDEKTEENKEEKQEKQDKEESDKKSEDDKKSDEKGTADDEEKGKDEEDKKSESEEARRRRRRRF